MRPQLKQPTLPRWLWAVVAITIAAILLGGYGILQVQARQLQLETEANLAAIARLKAEQIADWRAERLSNAIAFTDGPAFVAEVARWLETRRPDDEAAIVQRLKALEFNRQYAEVTLIDAAGQPQLSMSGQLTPLDALDLPALADGLRSGRPFFYDLHRPTPGGALDLDVVAPLLTPAGQPVGAIVLKIDPQHYLFPLLQTWPVPSASAETLLVRRDGDDVLWLNSLRYQPDAALNLRMPLSRTDVPAVMAVLGRQGAFRGADYRGVDVFSALEPVPDSPWFLVAKEDSAEALAFLRIITGLVGVSVAGLLATVVVAIGLVRQQVQKHYYRAIYAAEAERLALAKHFEYLVKYANDMILLTDADFHIVEVNDRTLEAYGYTREEMLKLSSNDLTAPADTANLTARLQVLKATGANRAKALHRRRDGSTFPVEVSAREIIIEGRRFYQGIQRDITERVRAEQIIQDQNEQLQAQNEELTAQHEELQAQHEELVAQQQELHKTEQELRENEEFLRHLLEHAPVSVYVTGADGRLRLVNARWEADAAKSRAEALGRPLEEIFPAATALKLRADNEKVAETGEPMAFEEVIEAPVEPRHFYTVKFPLHDASGQVEAVGGISIDITERKLAEEAVRHERNRAQGYLDTVETIIVALDTQGKITTINRKACQVLGWREDELIGQLWFSICLPQPEGMEVVYPFFLKLLDGETESNEYFVNSIVTRRGELRQIAWHNALLRDEQGRILGALSSGEDITERKQAEEALRESEWRFRTIFEQAAVGVALVNTRTGEFIRINQKHCDILGYSPAEMAHQTFQAITHPEDLQADLDYMRQLHAGEIRAFAMEKRFLRKDGSAVWVHLTVSPLWAEGQEPDYHISIVEDITGRKQTEKLVEEQRIQLAAQNEELTARNEELIASGRALAQAEADLQQINNELEARIQARSAELHTANADLQLANAALVRASRLKDEFLANMSHELRTPLTGVLGLVEVMEKGIYGAVNDKQRHALELVHGSGEHLLELINDILDLSKIEAGRMEMERESVSVEDICQASLAFILQAAHKKNIRWSYRRDPQVTQVITDGRRLKQMLVNLLSNAVKFTPEAGRVGLEVEGDARGSEVRLTVWDTGIGIPPEQQRYLFQPFVQLDGGLARKYEGTGLGLALVSSLAELAGGRVSVTSPGANQGARFTLTLPWSPETAAETSAVTPVSATHRRVASLAKRLGRPPVILAVDDSPVTLTVVSNFLEAADCQVLTAQNGAEALALVFSAHPDLMLLDIQMPDMSGLTVLQELRARWEGPPLPVIVLTALAMSGDRERYLASGADDYLSKPMSLHELAQAVARQLERISNAQGRGDTPAPAP